MIRRHFFWKLKILRYDFFFHIRRGLLTSFLTNEKSEWERKPKDYVHDELFLFFFPLHVKRASEWGGGGWGMFLYVSNNFLLFNHRYGACLLSIYSSCIILYSRKVKMVRGMGSLQGKSSTKGAKFILIDAAVVWKMYELFSCVQ